jgi:hypothetical protein
MENHQPILACNEQLLSALVDFWIAMAFPAIYLAKNL